MDHTSINKLWHYLYFPNTSHSTWPMAGIQKISVELMNGQINEWVNKRMNLTSPEKITSFNFPPVLPTLTWRNCYLLLETIFRSPCVCGNLWDIGWEVSTSGEMPFHTHNLREAIWSSAEAQRILSSSKIYGSKTSTSVTTVRLMSGKKKKKCRQKLLFSAGKP